MDGVRSSIWFKVSGSKQREVFEVQEDVARRFINKIDK